MASTYFASNFHLKSEDSNYMFASPEVNATISTLAKDTIERRVKAYELHKATLEKEASIYDPGLVDLALAAINLVLESKKQESESEPMAQIDPHILTSHLWDWYRVPYTMLRRAVPYLGEPEPHDQIDTWIFRNERWLQQPHSERLPWHRVLVTLEDSDVVFPQSTLTPIARTITRPVLSGFAVLDERRHVEITIQPSTMAFAKRFTYMTDNFLENLDWNNVLVAGGIVLGTLLAVKNPGAPDAFNYITDQWESSDIDIYLYGLSAAQATIKAQSIYNTFKANLLDGTPSFVVKNSKTITFYTRHPLRRVQTILKLGKTPKDILLNFDLDVCAVGWDGNTVWMLPRAACALETGYNVFTMSLIRGHYLTNRRATQPQRLLKYANKGYGLRFLASYSPPDIQKLMDSHTWATKKFREMTSTRGDGYILRHSDLLPHSRNCLTEFTSFMRSVAYWDIAQIKNPRSENFVSYEATYEVQPNAADHSGYLYDKRFSHAGLKTCLNRSNRSDVSTWLETDGLRFRLRHQGVKHGDELEGAQRITFAGSLGILLDSAYDIRFPLLLPLDFVNYANALVKEIPGMGEVTTLVPVMPSSPAAHAGEGLFFWIIPSALMWQQDNRQIDELFEVLLAFRRLNIRPIQSTEDSGATRFIEELSRHESLTSIEEEFSAFGLWVVDVAKEEEVRDW
ncbi:hypothetical protein B0H16DRAFT_1712823 [Mycena metata]|uniref:Uncharacterized protein n=1 Tax=Mycena metata TaxID=1033252 RepID=A0AAD7NV88_9AGAR|nr:hypothetical protein B0H16DRAFT_1712823 [Mycena metata]